MTLAEKLLHELLTYPEPCTHEDAVEALVAAYRQPPEMTATQATVPPLDLGEVAALLCQAAILEWDIPPSPFRAIEPAEPLAEITSQILEACWQCLLYDSRA